MRIHRLHRTAAVVAAGALVASGSPARAQQQQPAPQQGAAQQLQQLVQQVQQQMQQGGVTPPAAGGGSVLAPGASAPVSDYVMGLGRVAPTPPDQPLGGGNVDSSSSRPKIGNERDGFDLGRGPGSGGALRGNDDGPIFLDNEGAAGAGAAMPAAEAHTVRKGDTLWGIGELYFQNGYAWPRLWSYNPQVKNPHWIYPGDRLNLAPSSAFFPSATGPVAGRGGAAGPASAMNPAAMRRRVSPQTVFLREEGFVENGDVDTLGEITGAAPDKMFLTDFDEIYVRVAPGHTVHLGQELTIFRPLRSAGNGKVVQIQGTVRVNHWNAQARLARGTVIETLDVVERGARVAALPRRFEVVPPLRNDGDVRAHVLATVHFHNFYGQNQVVYIDRGADDGLKPGNRLLIVRRGDGWRQSLPAQAAATRIALESDSPAQIERIPPPRDEKAFPEQRVAELRVLSVRPHTAACLVTEAKREIETRDEAVARRGY